MNSPNNSPARGLAFKLAAVALTVVSALAGTGLALRLRDQGAPPPAPPPARKLPARLFRGWEKDGKKPALVLLLSAQQHGYLLPCGCSNPQVGGLERRYNFLQLLKKERGWPVVAVDLGDVAQREAPPGPVKLSNVQGLIKYRYSMYALKAMGYTATGVGEYEASLPLFNALGEFALQEPSPRVLVANMKDRDAKFPQQLASWQRAETPRDVDVRVGVTCVVGPTVAAAIKAKDSELAFTPSGEALKTVLGEMKNQNINLPVLLYQGLLTPKKPPTEPEAVACARAFPQIPVIVCLSEEDEPPANPLVVTDAHNEPKNLVIRLGHKGKYVGVLAAYRTGNPAQPFRFRYELVEMGEEYLTPPGGEKNNPVLSLMEDYTRELRGDLNHFPGGEYLAKYHPSKHEFQVMEPVPGLTRPGTPTYIGSDKCENCHPKAYKIWEKSNHHGAYQALLRTDKHPLLRQYDGECVMCHVTGFGYEGGFTDAVKTPLLKGVGCESCHGPGSVHAANPTNKTWRARMNRWKAPENETAAQKTARQGRIDHFCQECHNIDNDVTWKHGAFQKKWEKIQHPSD